MAPARPDGRRGGRPQAVIVGLDCITGLQTARLLARRDVPVIGVAANRGHFCCRTRVVDRIVTAPAAGPELADRLARLGPKLEAPAVLIPVTDAAVLAISAGRSDLAPWFRIALPPHEVVETLMDKVRFARFALEAGLPIPPTVVLRPGDRVDDAADGLRFPAVVKPALKTPEWRAHTSAKAIRVADRDALAALYARAHTWTDELIVQQWVPGGEDALYSWNGYVTADGRVIGSFVARKLRQWPPQTGTSSLGEEARNDEVLQESLRLIGSVPYRGLGYVEVKRDSDSGKHYIIEPNVGRPTGRSSIAEAGGVDLHYAAYCDLAGLPLPENLAQRYGDAKWIYLRHDLQAAALAWRRGELGPREWARSMRGVRADAVFARDDFGPFAADVAATVGTAFAGVARRVRPAREASGA